MRSPAGIAHTPFLTSQRPLHFLTLLLLATLAAIPLRAQQDSPPPPDDAPYTLHLYARLVELPTMILPRTARKSATLLQPQQVNIQLNSATPFHPVSLRIEGYDPLSIAFLLDVSGDQRELLSALQKNFSPWVARSLRPQDHVSIYSLDCNLVQTSNDVPANPSLLQPGLDLALSSPNTHGDSRKPSCGKSVRLRASIIYVLRKLSQLPGRRILVIVSGGRDGKTTIPWSQLNSKAGIASVTVFGLSTPGPSEFQQLLDVYNLTRASGGFLFSPTPDRMPKALDQIVSLLRGRYILQFPMPPDITPVVYRVFVTVPKIDALILPSGISVPLPNPNLDHPSTDLPSEVPPPDASPQSTNNP